MTKIKSKALSVVYAIATVVLAALLVLCVFRLRGGETCVVHAEDGPTYTTTDKLYLKIPDATSKSMTFSTIGGEVNGGVHSADVSSVTDTIADIRDWLEIYITRADNKEWNVPTADAVNGKWYYDSSKYAAFAASDNGPVTVWLYVKSEMPKNKLYTFLCNGEQLWQRRKDPYLSHPCDGGCTSPKATVVVRDGVGLHATSETRYSGNPFTDSKTMYLESPYPIGAGNGWKTSGSNTCDGTLGINPARGATKSIATVYMNTGECTVTFTYWIGAYVTSSALSAGPGQNANRAKAQRDSFSVRFSTVADGSAPELSAENMVSKTSVSATWADSKYSYATYSLNGADKGEYTAGTELRSEGKYVITATDCAGNSSNITLVVDKTAPKFSSEFYDAAGKQLIKYTKASSYVLPFPTNTGNESAIITRATYVRSYYDSAAGRIVTTAAAYYDKGGALTLEGKYDITVSDAAGNSSTCTVIIDRSPPVLSGAEYGTSNIAASYSYSAAESPIAATYTLTTSSGTSAPQSYASGMRLSAEGKYVITATDSVGNTATKTLYVDRTAPALSYAAEASASAVGASWTAREYESAISASYIYTSVGGTSAVTAYRSGQSLTAEGKYEITATDRAGNSSKVTLYVDRTKPTATVSGASKTSVKATFAAAAYESPVTATVKYNGDVAVPYASNRTLTEPGRYIFTVTDKAGNSSTQTTYVDRTAPALTRSFEYGNADGCVTFGRTDYESPISAVYSFVGNGETRSNVGYTSGAPLTDDGEYTVMATDGAGNVSSIKLIVDRQAPTFTYSDGSVGAQSITRSSQSLNFTAAAYESPVTVTYDFVSADEATAPSVEGMMYTSGSTFTAEGTYAFNLVDAAGNEAQATVIIDKTPPTLTFAASGKAFERYINGPFTAQGADSLSGVDKVELYENSKYVPYDYAPRENNGEYLFRVTDKAGNVTSATATVYFTDTFGNLASIRDSFKINAWYVVTLPARIFTTPNNDVAGRYSFESYDKALAFAVAKEREFRVTRVQGGYMYVSPTNEAVAQKYDTESSLSAVVEKYAKGYISARQTASTSGNDKYFTEPDSLTRNSPILPDYLLDLKDMPRYFVRPTTTWRLPNTSYISAMPYAVTAKYLGDFAEESTQEEVLIANTPLKDIAGYRQGWYLITERDEAGNIEQYLVYSDAESPTVRAHAVKGDGENDVTLDYDYTKNETLYFLALELTALSDNSDPYVTLKLEKGNTVKYFTQSDALPILGSEEYGSGKYTVTVFDRSLNALVFDVYIAGSAPTMAHGSLAADKPDCKISFVTSDRYNVITGITLYKIEHDGSKTALEIDGAGVPINAATLSYTLTIGGKYGATVTDNYRRTVEIPPIFFLKGLPSGKLEGVKDGERTNKNVSFTFDSGDVAEFFVLLPGGERQTFTDYAVQTGASQTTYNITADENTSHEYLVFLHNAQDLSLFVEYTFEIDTILPSFEITDGDGNVIEPDGATNKPFSIKWSETGVSVRYYTARSGQLGATRYNMNAVLSQGTLYYFTIKDDVGNTLDFTVLLDNAVDYTVGGSYNEVGGALYAKAPITFTVNEPTVRFDVVNADGFSIENGGTLTQEGRYEITVTDNYRNTITLVMILDFMPPSLSLDGVENGESVKNDVTVTASDFDTLYLADRMGNKIRDVENGETFSSAGNYYITAGDHAGNSVTVSFSIDLSVDYTLSVPNGGVTTSFVTLESAELLTVDVVKDGVEIESATRFTEPGVYELTLTDWIGNSVSCVFVILPSRMRTVELELPIGTRILTVMLGGNVIELESSDFLALDTTGRYTVTLDCGGFTTEFELEIDNTPPEVTLEKDGKTVKLSGVDKDNVTLKLTKDGEEINCSVGKSFDEPGHYVLTVTDELGNSSTYEFTIPFRLNTWAIVAIAVGSVALVVVLVLIIRARRKPRMK